MTTPHPITPAIAALRDHFAPLDNEIAKWADQTEALNAHLDNLISALQTTLGVNHLAVETLTNAAARYRQLLAQTAHIPAGVGFLNWRLYVLLNSFLLAVEEALEKFAPHQSEAITAQLDKSNYRPYFYDRLTATDADMHAMLTADLDQLAQLPPDKASLPAAFRLRNGAVAALMEEYCPTHPWVYPAVAQLDAVANRADVAVMDEIAAKMQAIIDLIGAGVHRI